MGELLDVGREAEANDSRLGVAEHLAEHVIEYHALLQGHKVDKESILESADLDQARLGLVELSELWSPLGVNSDELFLQQDRKPLDVVLCSNPVYLYRGWKGYELHSWLG